MPHIVISSLPMSRQRTSYFWFYNRFVHFPNDHQAYILRSHRTPDSLFQFCFIHPGCILCVIFASKSPFSANVDPRYLNAITLSKLSPCRLISEFPSKFRCTLNLLYTVIFLSADIQPPVLVYFQPPLFWCYAIQCHQQISCTTGIQILSHRPTHPYSWRIGKDSWHIRGVALWRNAHWDLVT